MKVTHIIISSLFFVFNSCDCVQKAKGIVVDSISKKPLKNVLIQKYQECQIDSLSTQKSYSDINGLFEYNCISGGIRKCPDLILNFIKEGYYSIKVTYKQKSNADTIYLKAINSGEILDQNNFNSNMDDEKSKLRISLSEGDSIIYKDFTISKPYRILGYSQANSNSEILIIISTYTDDIDEIEPQPRLGCFAVIGDNEDFRIKYISDEGNFIKAMSVDKDDKGTVVYFNKNQVSLK